MFAHCKKVFLLLALIMLGGASSLAAASLRWVHLGTLDAGLVNLAIDGKIAYRKMPPGKATPWGKIPPGLHRFQIGSERHPGASFELEISEGQRIVVVSVSDKNGDIQSRTVGMDAPQGEAFVLNAMPGSMMALPQSERKAIFGKGFRVPFAKAATTVSFADSDGLKGELDFSRLGAAPQGSYLAILSCDDDRKPLLSILRERDSLFEMGDQAIQIPDEMAAVIRIISEGIGLGAGGFDPMAIKWKDVDSRIFWLNLSVDRHPCRLEIRGFPAMRRIPAGRGSGFVKWPAGNWEIDVMVEASNKKAGSGKFSLSPKSGVGIISSGGGKYPHRLITLEGRAPKESGTATKSQIRFVNALPDGVLESIVKNVTKPVKIAIKPGESSDVLPLADGGFPGAILDLTLGKKTNKEIINLSPLPSLPPGDWVVVIHLNQESFSAPVLTWVEMDKGTITGPPTPGADG